MRKIDHAGGSISSFIKSDAVDSTSMPPRDGVKLQDPGQAQLVNLGRWRFPSRQSAFGQGRLRACRRILVRLARGEFARVFVRSHLARKVYSASRRQFEGLSPNPRGRLTPLEEPAVSASLSIDETARALHEDGFCPNLCLPAALQEEIREFAERSPCIRWGFDDPSHERFYIHDALAGELPDGRLVGIADVDAASSCSAIERLARDPFILGLYRQYFGFGPRRVIPRLFWSLVLDPAHPARAFLPNRGGKFHYDTEKMGMLYVFFYVTSVDRTCGPHALIPGSHRKKSVSLQMGDRFFSDADIHRLYGEGSELVVEGSAGYGFVEDPACIHKYYIPSERERLVLQLRYY
jgi:hypothetical protein